MATTFPPAPTYAEVVLVDPVTQKPRFNPIWLKWFLDIARFISTNGGGGLIDHNSLAGLQGGSATERYHLTAAEHAVAVFGASYAQTFLLMGG